MKKVIYNILIVLCVSIMAFSLFGCSAGHKVLAEPKNIEHKYVYDEGDEYNSLTRSVGLFSSRLIDSTLSRFGDENNNIAISPVTLYMALAVLSQCTSGVDKDEILRGIGISEDVLDKEFRNFFEATYYTKKTKFNREVECVDVLNSIWLDSGTSFNKDTVDMLARDYCCHSHSIDFAGDNKNANNEITKYVKKFSRGKIDTDFGLDELTKFTIVSALYMKALWNDYGDDLGYADKMYDFKGFGNKTTNTKMLEGYYSDGKVLSTDVSDSFHTRLHRGNTITFIVPHDGISIEDAMSTDNINAVLDRDNYITRDENLREEYITRCIFPEYEASFDGCFNDILREDFGMKVFDNNKRADMSPLTSDEIYLGAVRQVNKLTVDKTGIEGASVVVIPGATAPGPPEYIVVKSDFVVDRTFGYVIRDITDTPIFAGVVGNI